MPAPEKFARALHGLRDVALHLASALSIAALTVALVELARILASGDGALVDELHLLNGRALGVTTLLLALALLTVRALVNRLSVAVLTCAPLAFVLLIAHLQKMEVQGKPLVPSDLTLLRELCDVLGTVIAGRLPFFAAIALCLLGLVALIALCLAHAPRWPMRPAERLALLATSALLLGSELASPWFNGALEKRGVENLVWSYGYNLRMNGFLLPLALNARQVLPKPAGYSAEKIEALFEGLPKTAAPLPAGAAEKPDVIVFMAEAFWDATQLGERYSRDPVPNFHALAASHPLLTMTSPQRGGGTANVEFEALTGIAHGLLPTSSVPYQHYVHRPLRALPALFREQGYRTAALHNFHRYYFARSSVYPLLGFDRFIALDELEPVDFDGVRPEGFVNHRGIGTLSGSEALIDGHYPSDEPLVRRLLQELDAPGGDGDGAATPRFLFAIGMVGHGPFLYERWPAPDVTVAAGEGRPPLGETATHDLENMANAAFRADRGLGHLVRALGKRARPTLLVFFGDHLPALRSETFAEAGFDGGALDHRRYETQVLFWSNRPLPAIDAAPAFSVFYLSPKILAAAGLPLPRHLQLLAGFERVLPAMNDARLCTADGAWLPGPFDRRVPPEAREVIRALSLLGYDRLAGGQVSERP